MMRHLHCILFSVLGIVTAPFAFGETRLSPDYLFNSDPTARVINGRLYVFTTHDQATVQFQGPEDYWNNMMDYQAYSTTDLKTWVHHGSIFDIHDIAWADGLAVWDGDAGVEANGKFYAYASFRNRGRFEIGVLVADRPEGPYRDALGKPLLTTAAIAQQVAGIDGAKDDLCMSEWVVWDEHGKPWLLFGQFRVLIAPLNPDMVSFAGPVRELQVPRKAGNATEYIEAPMITRMGDRWYFSYLTYKNWDAPNPNFTEDDPAGPYIQYCVSDNLFGPYANPRHLIFSPAADACNLAHTIVPYAGRNILIYHVPYRDKQHRQIAVTELKVNQDGSWAPVYPAQDQGIVPQSEIKLLLDAFAPKRQAEEFFARNGAPEERSIKQDFHLKMTNGGWLRYKDMDFGTGASGFRISISCENSKIRDARVEFHLDAPDGPKIAETDPIAFTRWIAIYKEYTGKVSGAQGVHDVYIVAKGAGGDAEGRLFNVDWFTFTH